MYGGRAAHGPRSDADVSVVEPGCAVVDITYHRRVEFVEILPMLLARLHDVDFVVLVFPALFHVGEHRLRRLA